MKKLILCLCIFIIPIASSSSRASEISFEEDHSLPIVHLNVVFKTGSIDDPRGLEGISNIAGEMLLRGTTSRSKETIDNQLDFMGADLAVEARAEAVIIRSVFLSSQTEAFLALLEEILTRPSFPANELAKLKAEASSALLEEQGNDKSIASRRYNKFLFGDHPYGIPTQGTLQSIAKMNSADVRKQYQRFFREQRIIILGTGDSDPSRIQKWSQNLEKSLAGGEPIRSIPAPIPSAKKRLLFVNKPDRTQTQIFIGQVGIKMNDPLFFPLHIGNFAFGGGNFSARMMKEIRAKRGWSYGAYSNFRFGTQPRSWNMYYFPASKDSVQALALGLDMLKDVHEKGITEAEFEFSKKSLINSSAFMSNTPKKRIENQILEKTLGLPDGYIKNYPQYIEKATLEQVNSSLKQYLAPDRVNILFLGTAKDLKDPVIQAAGVEPSMVQVREFTEE